MPKVTVLLPTHNDSRYIANCIRSVLQQSYRDLELIVVNDASSDNTGSIVHSFRDQRLRYFRLKHNVGKGKAMNVGLAHARGKYILEIDGDDWITPTCVSELVRAMDAAVPNIACIYTDKTAWTRKNDRWVPTRLIKGPPFLNRVDWALHFGTFGARFYRASALRRIGGWPTDDPSGGRLWEDYAVMLRLLDHYKFVYLPRTLYNLRARIGSSSRSHRPFWRESVRSMYLKARKRWTQQSNR